MASPGIVRVAIMASVVTTSGAAYYFLSEGGDPEKLDANMKKTRETLDVGVKKTREKLDHLKMPSLDNILPKSGEEASMQIDVIEQEVKQPPVAEELGKQEQTTLPTRQKGAWCHTCSGPRIWFFAEKFRLKRRFTPYPDPPRD